jgi:hypothetical protein
MPIGVVLLACWPTAAAMATDRHMGDPGRRPASLWIMLLRGSVPVVSCLAAIIGFMTCAPGPAVTVTPGFTSDDAGNRRKLWLISR